MCATRLLQYNEHVFGIVLHPLHSFLQGIVFVFKELFLFLGGRPSALDARYYLGKAL